MAIQLRDTFLNLFCGRSVHGQMAKSLTKVEIQLGSSVLCEHLKILKGSGFFWPVFKCSVPYVALVMLTIYEDIYSTVQYAYKFMPVYLT